MSVLDELESMGISERKILNHLKKFRDEIFLQNKTDKAMDIQFNSYINELIFDGRFCITRPSQELMYYLDYLKKQYGSNTLYYMLTRVLEIYFQKGKVYEMTDEKKSQVIMYFLKNNQEQYLNDFVDMNKVYYDYNLDYEEE